MPGHKVGICGVAVPGASEMELWAVRCRQREEEVQRPGAGEWATCSGHSQVATWLEQSEQKESARRTQSLKPEKVRSWRHRKDFGFYYRTGLLAEDSSDFVGNKQKGKGGNRKLVGRLFQQSWRKWLTLVSGRPGAGAGAASWERLTRSLWLLSRETPSAHQIPLWCNFLVSRIIWFPNSSVTDHPDDPN